VVAFLISFQSNCSKFRLSVIAVQGLAQIRLCCQFSTVLNKFFSRNYSLTLFVITPVAVQVLCNLNSLPSRQIILQSSRAATKVPICVVFGFSVYYVALSDNSLCDYGLLIESQKRKGELLLEVIRCNFVLSY